MLELEIFTGESEDSMEAAAEEAKSNYDRWKEENKEKVKEKVSIYKIETNISSCGQAGFGTTFSVAISVWYNR